MDETNETNEWYCEFVLRDIPQPTEAAMQEAASVVGGVLSYDAEASELHGVFRWETDMGAGPVVTEALGRVVYALRAVLGGDGPVISKHRLKDFRIRPASDVPVDPDVQRYVDRMYGKGR
jgi:hypothetical protein